MLRRSYFEKEIVDFSDDRRAYAHVDFRHRRRLFGQGSQRQRGQGYLRGRRNHQERRRHCHLPFERLSRRMERGQCPHTDERHLPE